MNPQKKAKHLSHLTEQHQTLNHQIDRLEQQGNFNDHDINVLKKKRLALKDRITQLQQEAHR